MSCTPDYTTRCDGEGCGQWAAHSQLPTRRESLRAAHFIDGYVRRIIDGRVRDLCPACAWDCDVWHALPVSPSGMVTVQREGDEK